MTFKTKIKLSIIALIFTLLSFVFSLETYASDYQYKILDPKYNPSAEKIIKNSLAQADNIKTTRSSKRFDFGSFFAILALISLSFGVISLVMKSFKEVTEDVPGRNVSFDINQTEIKNNGRIANNGTIKTSSIMSDNMEIENNIENELCSNDGLNDSAVMSSNMTTPISLSTANVLNKTLIDENKGLGFIEKNQKRTLVGFINEKIFELSDFSEYKTNEIRAKLLEKVGEKDRYIVRMEKYKALVEVSEEKIDLILEL